MAQTVTNDMYLEPMHLWKSNVTHSQRNAFPGWAPRPMENVPSPPFLIAIHSGRHLQFFCHYVRPGPLSLCRDPYIS